MGNDTNDKNKENNHLLPDDESVSWKNTISSTARISHTAQQRMANFLEEEEVPLIKSISITDSQGIDDDDANIVISENKNTKSIGKDEQIKNLKEYIHKI